MRGEKIFFLIFIVWTVHFLALEKQVWTMFFNRVTRCHCVRNIVLDAERQEYFPRTVWNQLDPLCLWKESWKKRYSRGLCIRVEKISNGQTDPIRRQVGLPKFSIVERDSIFPPSLPFVVFSFLSFFFLQTQAFIIYRETCSLTCFANRSRDFERTNRMKKKF